MNRRAHLKKLLAGAGILAVSPWVLTACGRQEHTDVVAATASGRRPAKLGVQLFTVRELLRDDATGTLEALSAIGFAELEMFGFGGGSVFIDDPLFGLQLPDFKRLLGDLGLAVPTVHFSATEDTVAPVAAMALELGAHHLIQAMAPDFLDRTPQGLVVSGFKDRAHVHRLADDLNRLGAACKRNGIGFAYHNHHMEFVTLDNERAYDILLAQTDPELVRMELDVGWARIAGVDAADYLERFPERFVACHLKDFDPKLPLATVSATAPIPEMTQLVPPGDGIIDFPKVLAVMARTGVQHGYVEVDLAQGDPLEACRRGFAHLASSKPPA